MTLALNAGFYNTKIMTNTGEKLTIPSRVQINVDAKQSIEHDGFTYEVGAGARSLTDKTDSLCHYLMTEYAILKYANKTDNLMVALPLALYLNKAYRDRYQQGLLGKHEDIVDGEEKTVTISDCTVFAEGAGAYLANKELLSDKVVGILDFGGNTVNALIYSNGELVRSSITQLDLGVIKLERELMDAINQSKLWNLQEYELLNVIKSGECAEEVDIVMRSYMESVKERLLEKKWNIDHLEIFATGGGVRFIKPYLKDTFKKVTISNNPLYDNVIGLHEAGRVIYA